LRHEFGMVFKAEIVTREKKAENLKVTSAEGVFNV